MMLMSKHISILLSCSFILLLHRPLSVANLLITRLLVCRLLHVFCCLPLLSGSVDILSTWLFQMNKISLCNHSYKDLLDLLDQLLIHSGHFTFAFIFFTSWRHSINNKDLKCNNNTKAPKSPRAYVTMFGRKACHPGHNASLLNQRFILSQTSPTYLMSYGDECPY
jgi:hypothetical protein